MSKKKLLEEAQVRRMFQIAGIPAIGESFISDKFSRFNEEEEELPPEEMAAEEDPMAAEEDPMAADAEAPVDAAAGGDIPQDKVEAIVDAVLAGIEAETGVPLERVPEEGAAEEPAPGGEEEIAAAEEPPAEEPVPEDELALEAQNGIVNEVARRVARRLIRQAKKSK